MHLPEMLKTKWQPGMQGGLYETIDHLITQHNALCDYLSEKEKESHTPDRPLNQERE